MLETENKMVQMKESIERYVLHPYLRKYIISPSIDEDKLLMLISIVEELDLSPIEKDTYVIAITQTLSSIHQFLRMHCMQTCYNLYQQKPIN